MGAWGHGLFQSDHDFEIVSELTHDAGLDRIAEDANAKAKAANPKNEDDRGVYYSIYGGGDDREFVRKHLDSGALEYMIAEKEANMLAPPKRFELPDLCYVYVLLGACAMTLGCQLPDEYIGMLKKVYREGGLMPEAQEQMRKALFGPDKYKNGVPYDFESKDLIETANSNPDPQPNAGGFFLMNVMGPGPFSGMPNSTTSDVIKELRDQRNNPDACGGCGQKPDKADMKLLLCSRCKGRKYCGVECQKSHWKVHKKVCDSVA
ncbi:hypothetical protein BDV95DRAFT_626225 [Massariosphaeria phaeospora]|uniref:MYND-type domain-containing protein n=1 Tax=Massariosphaeria phaeospora TaxID=100035 RepID=A0A7C8MV67_9PLEO|nr:hypothetical protein BDV95DRAFT_626225 [Massariosphaeria phaeospora]